MSMGKKHFGNNLAKVQDPREIRAQEEAAETEKASDLAKPNRAQKSLDDDRQHFVNVNGADFRVTPKGRHD